ncbi:hypothetical protein PYW08_015897 [Mythimna loreyi]|uniref:Uncharacterized protein n=1 Tax=Mythimna loreyi TaxID=667449 RepID=A0ACC2QX56_9NEOP|nr:hypothetical protein PYW08_015897 [Mythimna loreyi]
MSTFSSNLPIKMQRNQAFSSSSRYQSYSPSPCFGPPRNQYYPNASYAPQPPQPFQPNTCFMPANVIRKMSNTTPPKGFGRNF